MRILKVTPSEAFVDDEIGEIVMIGDKFYRLVARDPWACYVVHLYWIKWRICFKKLQIWLITLPIISLFRRNANAEGQSNASM